MDPWGHMAPWLFKDTIEKDDGKIWTWKLDSSASLMGPIVDIRPTIAITKAHMKVSSFPNRRIEGGLTETSAARTRGECEIRASVGLPLCPTLQFVLIRIRVPDGKVCLNEFGELAVTKFAVEPV